MVVYFVTQEEAEWKTYVKVCVYEYFLDPTPHSTLLYTPPPSHAYPSLLPPHLSLHTSLHTSHSKPSLHTLTPHPSLHTPHSTPFTPHPSSTPLTQHPSLHTPHSTPLTPHSTTLALYVWKVTDVTLFHSLIFRHWKFVTRSFLCTSAFTRVYSDPGQAPSS